MEFFSRLSQTVRQRWNSKKDRAKLYAIFGAGYAIGGTVASVLSYVNNKYPLGLCSGVAFITIGSLVFRDAYYTLRKEWTKEEIRVLLGPKIQILLKRYVALLVDTSEEEVTDEMTDREGIRMMYLAREEMGETIKNDEDLKAHVLQNLIKNIRYHEKIKFPERFPFTLPDEVEHYDIYSVLHLLGEEASEHFRSYVSGDNRVRQVPYSRRSLDRYEELINRPSPARCRSGTSLLTQQIEEMNRMRTAQDKDSLLGKRPEAQNTKESEEEFQTQKEHERISEEELAVDNISID